MNYQLWIQNPNHQPFDKTQDRFIKLGPPTNSVDANLWLQALRPHCGGEVQMRPVQTPAQARVTARSDWPGEG